MGIRRHTPRAKALHSRWLERAKAKALAYLDASADSSDTTYPPHFSTKVLIINGLSLLVSSKVFILNGLEVKVFHLNELASCEGARTAMPRCLAGLCCFLYLFYRNGWVKRPILRMKNNRVFIGVWRFLGLVGA
jgi:hypothetical protein